MLTNEKLCNVRFLIDLSIVGKVTDFRDFKETEIHTIPSASKHLIYNILLFCKDTVRSL